MLDLLKEFSIEQVVIYTIMLALAIKGGIDFFTWVKDRYQKKFDKDYNKKQQEETLVAHYIKCSEQHQESMACYKELKDTIDKLAENLDKRINKLDSRVEQLVDSDKNDIKSWIVEKHHDWIGKEWIDDFTMDTIEHRFTDYVAEGGNSYIEGLVKELRALPHIPPEN